MILATYKSDAHPPGPIDCPGVGTVRYRAGVFGDRAEQAIARRVAEFEVLGPWSLQTSRRFWEGFTPAALPGEPARPGLRCPITNAGWTPRSPNGTAPTAPWPTSRRRRPYRTWAAVHLRALREQRTGEIAGR